MFDYEYWGFGTYRAAVNMALEEAMLLRAKKKAAIRFFDFAKDSVVLGYAQATDVLKKRNADVVRRITGGSHVQTGKNILAYSIAVPRDSSFSGYEDMRAYYAEKIKNALEGMGIEDVTADNRASSINIGNKVVAGHSMFWGVESALLHGLILMEHYQIEKLAARIELSGRKIGPRIYSEYDALKNAPVILSKTDIAKNAPKRNDAVKRIMAERILAELTKGKHASAPVSAKTVAKAMPLLAKRYGNDAWTEERSPSFTHEQAEEIPGEELNGGLKKKLGYCLYLQVNDRDFRRMASND
ncbi:MAG: lipoate--protein ligase family protein [Candidatus Aenigmarchaeota archaeon]|nr:lipoate--protein ligase family protein [Candidatus Aenigmarchaeota archaeon]